MTTPTDKLADYSDIVPDERRRRLLNAAMDVMAANTLENMTMDSIALAAGVTRVTLYREFGNRGTLIEAVAAFRLMLFDERFFANAEQGLSFPDLVQSYLLASTRASKNDPVSRRWAGGGMKFIQSGSLIHRTASASWRPVIARYKVQGDSRRGVKAEEIALWLIILQYSLGRMMIETECDEQVILSLVMQFVSPAFLAE